MPKSEASPEAADPRPAPAWRMRGIRGATVTEDNSADSVHAATRRLLRKMVDANDVDPEEIAAVLFSVTSDLNAAFPAAAARQLGWDRVPLLDLQEAANPSDLPRCIRVLMLVNTTLGSAEIRHIYEGEAARLRPDMSDERSLRP